MAGHDGIGVGDFVLLDEITTEKFIQNLQKRFASGRIYTYIGEVCVSVNPYSAKNIYGPETVAQYSGREMFENPPHIFAIADSAHKVMKQQVKNTCIVISGESGSGKTEASKIIMKYIAAVTNAGGRQEIERVKNVLLQSNAILEAFGNAKTNRNDNSSRFGKYMDINFDFKGDPIGGHINNYLLEKSRVVLQQMGERNFHSFYQLLSGCSDSELKSYGLLRDPETYFYTKQGGANKVEAISDRRDFKIVLTALKALEFSQNEVDTIWKIVAAILHLGNITFREGDETIEIIEKDLVEIVSKLLDVEAKDLRNALSKRVIAARGEVMEKNLTLSEGKFVADALAKAIYDRLFTWIVKKVNDAINTEKSLNFKYMKGTVIGVLDIYGFEIFEMNSFEQFCINYCNEKLQQLFIELVLKQEQEEYLREGIEWTNVEYFNNQIICDLVEQPHKGILAIMDEACLNVGKVTDELLLEAMDKQLAQHSHYASRQLKPMDKTLKHKVEFRIVHYAGDVTYSINGFLEKNKDTLFQDLKRLMYNSKNTTVSSMWPEGEMDITKTTKRPLTAGSLFRNSMIALVKSLSSKEPFYVRCIKPNEIKSASVFDHDRVEHQVRYLGLVENVRVRRAGFAYRQRYDRFLKRYKMISTYTWPNFRGNSDKEAVQVLLESVGFHTDVEYGKTKVFIRSPKTLFALEKARSDLIPSIVILLQKQWRGALCRFRYKKMKAAYHIMLYFRNFKRREYVESLARTFKNAPNLKDYGKSLPWPTAPMVVQDAVPKLKTIFNRWWAWMMLRKIPRSDWPQLKLKMSAASALYGKRSVWGQLRKWEGNYLSQAAENSKASVFTSSMSNLKNSDHFQNVLFSSFIHKTNKHNKTADRGLLVTDHQIYKIDTIKFKPMKKGLLISQVTGISVSPGSDQLIVIHSNVGNDLVVSLQLNNMKEDLVGELLGILLSRYQQLKKTDIPVTVSSQFQCTLGKKVKTIKVETSTETTEPDFFSSGDVITYKLPSSYSVPVKNGTGTNLISSFST
ncbi:hypothetical protein RUM44_006665 [Polyplax serrata]|uniref:Myosin-IA n=1 Tax=Polyplax serrata TaxID=468196 RepID=A0ABR1AIP5_POLSC